MTVNVRLAVFPIPVNENECRSIRGKHSFARLLIRGLLVQVQQGAFPSQAKCLRQVEIGEKHSSHTAGEAVDHSLDQEIVPDSGHAESPVTQAPLAAVDDGGVAQASLAFPTGSNSSRPADGRVRIYWIWAVCGFLLLAVGLVFGQTVRHEFIGYDDDGFVYENPHVTPGLTLSGTLVGADRRPFW